MFRALGIAVFMFAFCKVAASQSIIEKLSLVVCSKIVDDTARLKCFDSLVVDQLESKKKVVQKGSDPKPANANWTISNDKSKMDDSPIVTLILLVDEPTAHRFGSTTAALLIRCSAGKTAFILGWDYHFASYNKHKYNVKVRLDKNPAVEAKWDVSNTGTALGLFEPPQSVKMINILSKSKTVAFELETEQDKLIASFTLDGLSESLDPVRQGCSWQ